MNELEQQFNTKYAEYEVVVRTGPVSRVRQLNGELTKLLNEMLTILARVREQSGRIKAYQDELIAKLARIQQDANALARDKDTLETLRRIRSFEETTFNKSLYLYLILFFACVLLVLAFMYVRNQKTDTSSVMSASPPMSPPLM